MSLYQAAVPPFMQQLQALSGVLDKAEAHAAAKKIDPAVLLGARLFPDMFAFTRQVQLVTDFAKGASARLAGLEVPSYEDTEKTFAELKARVRKTLDFLQSLKPAQIDGSEERDIEIKIGGKPVTFKGQVYLVNFALPNFYFHATTAYAILRHNGVELGKRDFVGTVPGFRV
ncbi:MAG: DUF1993 domain-containing protein [Hyphomicrobiaceae bacterium]